MSSCLDEATAFAPMRFGGVRLDKLDLDQAIAGIAARLSSAPFDYVCTPNAEFVDWARRCADVMALLDNAFMSTNDSRVLAKAARWRGKMLDFAPGSSIVRELFERGIIGPTDPLLIVGGTAAMPAILAARYGLRDLRQHIPPMGFIRDAVAIQAAIDAVEARPARFVFIAMGPPHSELLAAMIKQRGRATGLGLAIGSALGTLAGLNSPAPHWMERHGLVWLHRLCREPRRLWRRYLGSSLRGLLWALWRG